MSTATAVAIAPDDAERGAIEACCDEWADALNALACWVLDHVSLSAWHDVRRSWLDLRAIFGPAPALRLLAMGEIAALVPPDAD